jgi:hypothetical protein
MRITQRIDNRSYDAALSTRDLFRVKGTCRANSEAWEFSPADVWVSFQLEKGRTG